MDKTKEKDARCESGRITYFKTWIDSETAKRRESREVLVLDISVFICALIFVRESMIFGSYPLSLALISVLPCRVLIALCGVALGALTIEGGGIIYAMTSVITVLLRAIVSGGGSQKNDSHYTRRQLFHESILLRASISVIGGFIAAVYRILLSGLAVANILYGVAMILMPPIITVGLSGIFSGAVTPAKLLGKGGRVFGTETERSSGLELAFFQASVLFFVLLISLSLSEYSVFGISFAYVFSGAVTLFTAKRFGAIRGAAVGFISSLGVSGANAAAFMLAGLASGALFPIGALFAIAVGAMALGALSAYIGGVVAFASTLPEYILGASLIYPFISKMPLERTPKEADKTERSATDMVGTMALLYRNRVAALNQRTVGALRDIGRDLDDFFANPVSKSEFAEMVVTVIKRYVPFYKKDENTDKIATKLCKNEQITPQDIDFIDITEGEIKRVCSEINRMRSMRVGTTSPLGEELRLISSAIADADGNQVSETRLNESRSDALTEILYSAGFPDGVIRVFGERKPHVILSGRDEDGSLVTSDTLRRSLEGELGTRLGAPEYFRRDNMVLMECTAKRSYSIRCGRATMPGKSTEISGDVAHAFDTPEDRFYSLVLDGMGSGSAAYRAARFSSSMLEHALTLGASRESAVYLLNSYLLRGREECSVALDMFEFDLINREALFLKSGAAPSYIKRGSSIFRIRSQTAPIGLKTTVDSEKIRVSVEVGDYIIMLSDGVVGVPEDAPWLLELLSARTPETPEDFAQAILSGACSGGARSDDMTVVVLRIESAA